MAKRGKKSNTATDGPREYLRPLVEFEHGGIYRYARIVGYESVALTQDEFEQLAKPADIGNELAGAVTAARSVAADKIRQFLKPLNRTEKTLDDVPYTEANTCLVWQETARYEIRADDTALYSGGYYDTTALLVGDQFVTIIDVGEGARWYALGRKPPDDVAVALAALRAIEHMKAGGDAATFHAFRLGRLLERLNAMQFEPDALRGKKSTRRGKEANRKRAEQLKLQREWVRREYRNTLSADPDRHMAAARKRVRARFSAQFPRAKLPADSTIEEWVRTPRKRDGGSAQSQS